MVIDSDDAKTDVILTAAVAAIGPTMLGFVTRLPVVPTRGTFGVLIELLAVLLLTVATPLALARHRRDGAAAFALAGGGRLSVVGSATDRGEPGHVGRLLLAVPAIAAGVATMLLVPWPGAAGGAAVLGRPGPALAAGDLPAAVLSLLWVLVHTGAALLLVAFLSVRGRDGFPRSPDVSPTELIRTIGLGATGVAVVTGLVRLTTGGGSIGVLSVNVLALVALLLLVDRATPARGSLPRTTLAAPLVVVVVVQVFAAGGVFGGGLLLGLHRASLATGVVLAIAVATTRRSGAAVALPLLLAVHWWPTCLSPLPTAAGMC